jgi:hypothetical protein
VKSPRSNAAWPCDWRLTASSVPPWLGRSRRAAVISWSRSRNWNWDSARLRGSGAGAGAAAVAVPAGVDESGIRLALPGTSGRSADEVPTLPRAFTSASWADWANSYDRGYW